MLAAADREIRPGIWKIHILHHAATREVWGTWLLDELAEHGHRPSPGTRYPAVARMAERGWLRRLETGHPRARQPDRITCAGRTRLRTVRREVLALYQEEVLGGAPAHAPRSTPRP